MFEFGLVKLFDTNNNKHDVGKGKSSHRQPPTPLHYCSRYRGPVLQATPTHIPTSHTPINYPSHQLKIARICPNHIQIKRVIILKSLHVTKIILQVSH